MVGVAFHQAGGEIQLEMPHYRSVNNLIHRDKEIKTTTTQPDNAGQPERAERL
jgi:hypothetical protein